MSDKDRMNEFIIEISIEDRKQWDKIVVSFSDYEVFYLSRYVAAFMEEDEKNGIPILLYYQSGDDRAINVVLKRDIAKDSKFDGLIGKNMYFDLSTPYGYGGFWGDITDYEKLNRVYQEYCTANHYICEFVRFQLFSDYYKYYDGEVETRTHNVVRRLELSIEDIWMDFRQKVRKNVKKANRNGLQIILDHNGKYLEEFLEIYYRTMKRSNAKREYYFSKNFFENFNQMEDNIMYFHAVYEGKIISSELVIYGAKNCYSFLGGTNSKYFDLRPNDFLKYEIIKWAKKERFENFVLGGGYGTDDGVYQYKLNLAPQGVMDFYIGKKIYDVEVYKRLVELRKDSIEDRRYFPLYRG